ncbi:type VI secretion system baseplate subunit TssK [Massilia glaciei]|nr:type VI secretion system baseplate subunit TssK [Massilia glaciei]
MPHTNKLASAERGPPRQHGKFHAHRPNAWGVRHLLVEREALLQGRLRIEQLSLIFEDGKLLDAPSANALPDVIELGRLAQTRQALTLHAAWNGTGAARLLPEPEPRDAGRTLALLRVRRLANGGFELDPAFVPPSLTVHGAPALLLHLRCLIDTLQANVDALHAHQHTPGRHAGQIRCGGMSTFRLLHTASSALASLSYYFHHPGLHPERLHAQLVGLAVSLKGLSTLGSLDDVPAYDHGCPGPCFAKLHLIICKLLDSAMSPINDCTA